MALGPDTRKNSLSVRGPSTHDLGINNADDFRIGKRLANLPKLREIGFAANRWLLEVERLSHEMHSRRGRINRPITLNGQRASGFRSANMRNHLAALSGRTPATIGHGANDLFIFAAYAPTARSSASPAVTAIASPTPVSEQPSSSREPNRLLRPTLAVVLPSHHAAATLLKRSFDTPDTRIIEWLAQTNLAGQT